MKREIKKTKTKRTKKKVEITPGQFGMVLEDVKSKFDFLVEGFSGLKGQVENLDKKIDDNHQEFLEFRSDMLGFKNEFINFRSETNNNFKAAFEYLSKIDDEIQLVKLEIKGLKSKLSRKADLDKLLQLEKRVIVLEERICLLSQSS